MSVIADGDSSMMATIWQAVSYGIFMNKIECANLVCKAYRSRHGTLAKDNPEYCGRGGLTKKAIQRLTAGDWRNRQSHVFGEHTNCSKDCTFQQKASFPDDESDEEDQPTLPTTAEETIKEQINNHHTD